MSGIMIRGLPLTSVQAEVVHNDLDARSARLRVSAVMPCLNEVRTLPSCIRKAQSAFTVLGVLGEVVVADNGSSDGSADLATVLGAHVVHEPTRGYGAAL